MIDYEHAYQPGQILAGKYRVDRTLGVGGFGVVVAAMHLQLEERVAIKILLPEAIKSPAASERFLREAKAAVRIRSEHVARVTDVGTFAGPDGGQTPYMVMEYLEGCDLSTLLKARGAQLVPDVCEWIMQSCEAIAEAHALGIVHRDLKPANLFLTHRVDGAPCIKVLDFGISKIATESDKAMTKSSDVMGSPYYMSPEQMRSTRAVDARSDIWALGAIVYELLAGAPPFDGETMTALIVNIMQDSPRDLLTRRSDVPRPLYDVVMRCLQKDPNNRFNDVSVLAHALAPYAPARAQQGLSRVSAALSTNPSSGQRGSATSNPAISSHPSFGGPSGSVPALTPSRLSPAPMSPHGVAQNGYPQAPQGQGGHVSGGHISGGHISTGGQARDTSIEGAPPTLVPDQPYSHQYGSQRPSSTNGPPRTLPGDVSSSLSPAATAMGLPIDLHPSSPAPQASWAGTYAGQRQKSSRLPLFVGLGAIAVGALAASGFILFRNRAPEPNNSAAGVVALPSATQTAAATTPQTAAAGAPPVTSGAVVVQPADPQPGPPPVSTGKPGKPGTPTHPPPTPPSPVVVVPPSPVVTPAPVVTPPAATTEPKKPGLFDTPH